MLTKRFLQKYNDNEGIQVIIEYGILDILLNKSFNFFRSLEFEISLQAVIFILTTLKSKVDFNINNRKLILIKISEFDYVTKITEIMHQENEEIRNWAQIILGLISELDS